MEQIPLMLNEIVSAERWAEIVRALVVVAVGLLAARVVGTATGRLLLKSGKDAYAALARRAVSWTIGLLAVGTAVEELGFDLSILLGAAGIVTVALGFASQTSASNIISGLFLVLEGAISVGDLVRIGPHQGEVLSIDLLSVKIRTFDNLLVRVPNETVVKSEITNLTKYPIRRVDIPFVVPYGVDIAEVERVVRQVCHDDKLVLREPELLFRMTGFGEWGANIEVGAWCATPNILRVRSQLQRELKAGLQAAGIDIPYPHRTLVPGSQALSVELEANSETPDVRSQ